MKKPAALSDDEHKNISRSTLQTETSVPDYHKIVRHARAMPDDFIFLAFVLTIIFRIIVCIYRRRRLQGKFLVLYE